MKLRIEIKCDKCSKDFGVIDDNMNMEGYSYLQCPKCKVKITLTTLWTVKS